MIDLAVLKSYCSRRCASRIGRITRDAVEEYRECVKECGRSVIRRLAQLYGEPDYDDLETCVEINLANGIDLLEAIDACADALDDGPEEDEDAGAWAPAIV